MKDNMMFLVQIFAQIPPVESFEMDFNSSLAIIALVYLAGICSLLYWMIKTSCGTTALIGVHRRWNGMPFYLPFLIIFIWLAVATAASRFVGMFTFEMSDWQREFFTFLSIAAVELVVIVLMIAVARRFFYRGIKGLGLNFRTVVTDGAAAVLNLVSVWPVVMGMIVIVLYLGTRFGGEDFQMQQNTGLEIILIYDNIWLRILMIVFAAGITPVFEELLFRGLFQTMLRSFNVGPWSSIFLTSIIFAALHPPMHLPALLVLSVCIGYSYEKSGSLFRPIFIHLLFNAVSITFALLQA